MSDWVNIGHDMTLFTTCSRFSNRSSATCYVLTRTDLVALFWWLTSAIRVSLVLVLPRFLGRLLVCYGGTLRHAVWHSMIVRTPDFAHETQSIYRYQKLVSDDSQKAKPAARNLVGHRLAMNDRVLFAALSSAGAPFAGIDVTFFFEHTVIDPRMHLSLDMLVRIIRCTWMYKLRWFITVLSFPQLFAGHLIGYLRGRGAQGGFVLTLVTSDLCTLTLDAPGSVVHGWSNDMHTLERNAKMFMGA